MAPMGDSLANPDGTISEAQLAYFEARARGGAALLLVGSVAVAYPDGCVDERQVAASLPEHDAGLRALADRVHDPRRHGGRPVDLQRCIGPARHRTRATHARPGNSATTPAGRVVDDGDRRRNGRIHGAVRGARRPRRLQDRRRYGHCPGRDGIRRCHRSVSACRDRRRRIARRPRVPHRRVPLTRRQHPHRRLGRQQRGPVAAAHRDHPGDPRAGRPRLSALDAHQRTRAPQSERRAFRRPARHHRTRGGCRARRSPRDRVLEPRRRDRADGLLRPASGRRSGRLRRPGPRTSTRPGRHLRSVRT